MQKAVYYICKPKALRTSGTEALLGPVVDGEIVRHGLRVVGERQVRRLLLVHCVRERHRVEQLERELPVRLRVLDRLAILRRPKRVRVESCAPTKAHH